MKWIYDSSSYFELCEAAAKYQPVFEIFRGHAAYRAIVETVSIQHGLELIGQIKQECPERLIYKPFMKEVLADDLIGGPIQFEYANVGWLAPTTLRYIVFGNDILRRFSPMGHIVEIGVGYGRQCKILRQMTSWESYLLVDDPRVLALAQRYLGMVGVTPDLVERESYDLVFSTYAISEFDAELQEVYFERYISKAHHGFLWCEEPVIDAISAKASHIHRPDTIKYPNLSLYTW